MRSEIVKFIKKQADIFSAETVQSILKEGAVPARIIDEVMKEDKDTATTTTSVAPSSFQSFRKDRDRMRQLKESASSSASNSDGILIFWLCLFKGPHFSFFVSSSRFFWRLAPCRKRTLRSIPFVALEANHGCRKQSTNFSNPT